MYAAGLYFEYHTVTIYTHSEKYPDQNAVTVTVAL